MGGGAILFVCVLYNVDHLPADHPPNPPLVVVVIPLGAEWFQVVVYQLLDREVLYLDPVSFFKIRKKILCCFYFF